MEMVHNVLPNVENVIIKSYNEIAVVPELLDCDYYRFRNGDI